MNKMLLSDDKYTSKKTLRYIERNSNIDKNNNCLFEGNKCIINNTNENQKPKLSKSIINYFRSIFEKIFYIFLKRE